MTEEELNHSQPGSEIPMYIEKSSGKLRFSPSDLTLFLESEFGSWMDRWHCERLNGNLNVVGENGLPLGIKLVGITQCEPDGEDAELTLIANQGLEHEQAFLEQLYRDGHEIEELSSGVSDLTTTLAAMQQGREVIFQARLEQDEFAGFADFLYRIDGKSKLGDHHYEVWDTKLARSPKAYFVVQLCAYSEMLGQIQGKLPAGFEVVLGTRERVRFQTNQFLHYYRQLKQSFLDFQEQFDASCLPDPGASRNFGRWSNFAEQLLDASDHLS